MSNVYEIKDTAKFLTKFDEVNATGEFFIVYLTGGIKEASGKSWCPDCDFAQPAIDENILSKTSLRVLKGVVENSKEWVGVPTHPYKKHPIIKAGGVPSVVLVKEGQALLRAESRNDFRNSDLLRGIACPEKNLKKAAEPLREDKKNET